MVLIMIIFLQILGQGKKLTGSEFLTRIFLIWWRSILF